MKPKLEAGAGPVAHVPGSSMPARPTTFGQHSLHETQRDRPAPYQQLLKHLLRQSSARLRLKLLALPARLVRAEVECRQGATLQCARDGAAELRQLQRLLQAVLEESERRAGHQSVRGGFRKQQEATRPPAVSLRCRVSSTQAAKAASRA